jgi:hypothetical protein
MTLFLIILFYYNSVPFTLTDIQVYIWVTKFTDLIDMNVHVFLYS